MDVSVVVAVRNCEHTLPALLASLAQQDCVERYEVIVVDDASTDDSLAVARDFARHLPVVICEMPRQRGPGAARNAGVERSRAAILAFCDGDDIVHRSWLRSLSAAIRRRPLVAGAIHPLDHDAVRPPASVRGKPLVDPAGLTSYHRHLPWGLTANLAVRRDVFAEIGGFAAELRTGEDADLCWRLAAQGVELAYEPAAVVFKRALPRPVPTFRQWLRYGLGHPLLFRRHRHGGMPRRSPREAASRYAETARTIGHCVRHPRSGCARGVAARLGQDVGRVIGSVRWRSLYL
jgi:mycofactocin glycosyltransferase